MLNIRNVARAVREVWLKGTDAEGCIPGGSAEILAKLGILAASLVAGIVSFVLLRSAGARSNKTSLA